MTIMEYIEEERNRRELHFKYIPEKLGISWQRYYQIKSQQDCRFDIAKNMLAAIGQEFDVRGKDGEILDIDVAEFIGKLIESDVMFEKAKEIVEAAGFTLYIKDAETHDGTCERKEIRI